MPTADQLALITAKKLLGYIDFDVYLKQYLVKAIREATKRLFIQGSFDERMPLSSPGANQVQVDLKPTYGDGFAHDGSGRLLDLEQIDRTAYFENVGGQTYEVGAEYIEVPVGIRVNPRTGKYEFDHLEEGIGRQAAVNVDTVGASTLTFVVDPLFEEGVAPGDHSGRQVRVFTIVPGDAATSEAIAIETATVFYDGQNKITTAGYLGETVPGTIGGWYVQLIGITVFRDTATNKPSLSSTTAFFIGTVDGNGGVPATFDITGQNVISAQSANFVTLDPLPDWYDGTPNNETDVQAGMEKIVYDLATYISGDIPIGGAEKIAATELPNWFDGTTNPADSIQGDLYKIVDDLSDSGGGGAAKISAAALSDWADGTTNPAGSIQALLTNLVDQLVATTGLRGAGKVTSPALPNWADTTINPADTIAGQLEKIVTDLATDGILKIAGTDLFPTEPYTLGTGILYLQLAGLVNAVNETAVNNERKGEFAAITGIKSVFDTLVGSSEIRDIAAQYATEGDIQSNVKQLYAVGNGGKYYGKVPGSPQWGTLSAASGYTGQFNAICRGPAGWAMVGSSGEIQSIIISTTRRKTGGNDLHDVVYNASAGVYCAVGDGGDVWTSPDLVTWTQQTAAPGMTTFNLVGIATDGNLFVVVGHGAGAGSYARIMTSPTGLTGSWTQQTEVPTSVGPMFFIAYQLQYTPRHGFVVPYFDDGTVTLIGVSQSDDGVTWNHFLGTASVNGNKHTLCLLDRQIAYFTTNSSFTEAVVVETAQQTPNFTGLGLGQQQPLQNVATMSPRRVRNIHGTIYAVGIDQVTAHGCVYSGGPSMRPNTIYSV